MTNSDWIKKKLLEKNLDAIEVSKLYVSFCQDTDSKCSTRSFKRQVYTVRKKLITLNQQLLDHKTDLLQTQKAKDVDLFEAKQIRESARAENSLLEYNKKLVSLLEQYDFSKISIKHKPSANNAEGIIQISDAHFNELVSLTGNTYDFTIASKRLKKLASQAKKYFSTFSIKNVLLVFTGDLLNSNRRLDELLNQATNRAQATILAFFLLEQFILDLNNDFNIQVASVTGNESRIEKEPGSTEIMVSDNFDSIIENMLKIVFRKCPGITFIEGDSKEKLVKVAGQNILILHGENITKNNQASIQQIAGSYAFKGILVDYVLYGHYHSAHISDFFARSSSMVGSNAYNEKELGLIGRSSQNIFVFYGDKNRDAIKIDLQNTDNIEGYNIYKELEAYNAKSVRKLNHYKSVVKI